MKFGNTIAEMTKAGDLKVLQPICQHLAKRAELFVVDGGEHSLHVLRSSSRSDDQVLNEVARKVAAWTSRLIA